MMSNLEIKIYNENFVSIKDLTNELKISDAQWNALFTTTVILFDNIYFNGQRIWSVDFDFDNTINYISEQTFVDTKKYHSEILFRLKSSFLMHNRKFVSNMWKYYEYPSFIFLDDKRQEEELIQAYKKNIY